MNPAVQPFSPSQVRHHRFCFCVPCRWGTWILSGTTGVVSGMVATANFLSLLSADTKPAGLFAVHVAAIFVWTALLVICGYGWLGTIKQKRSWVEWYYELCWWHLWANAFFGFFGLLFLNLPSSRLLTQSLCETARLAQQQLAHVAEKVTDAEAATIISACRATATTGLIITDLAWIIALLIELWLVLVVGHYVDELAEREAAARFGVDIENPLPPYHFVGPSPSGADVRDEPAWQKYHSAGKGSQGGKRRTSKRWKV